MFAINKDIIYNIIKKAREIDIADDIVPPDEDAAELSDNEWSKLLAEYQGDLSFVELKNLINDLEPDQQQHIIALMYIGRGDFDKNEWHAALKQAEMIHKPSRADYLISKNLLADYLTEGLAKFNILCEE